MIRRQARTSRKTLLALLAVAFIATSCIEIEPPFGPSEGGLKYTDNSTLTYRSVECTSADRTYWDLFMDFSMVFEYSPTDLTVQEQPFLACNTYHNNDDIYWFATPQINLSEELDVVGDWLCIEGVGGDKCNRGRLRIAEDAGLTPILELNLVCHEIAHAIGFQHGNTGLSCMDSGDNAMLDAYMIGRINDKY